MALGRQGDRQGDLVVPWKEMPRSPGHVFYDRLQGVLIDAGFDAFAETTCKPYYAAKMGAIDSAWPVLPDAHGRSQKVRVEFSYDELKMIQDRLEREDVSTLRT